MKKNREILTRRTVIASAIAAASVRTLPQLATKAPAKRVLEIVIDKATGAMRAVDRVVR